MFAFGMKIIIRLKKGREEKISPSIFIKERAKVPIHPSSWKNWSYFEKGNSASLKIEQNIQQGVTEVVLKKTVML